MNYRLLYTASFRSDIAAQVDYLREQQVADYIIERWYDRLFARLELLAGWPKSYPLDQRTSEELGREIRKFLYARYVITYYIDEGKKHVLLLAMVHGARRK
jgi:plasmid stabilization system protein ParE